MEQQAEVVYAERAPSRTHQLNVLQVGRALRAEYVQVHGQVHRRRLPAGLAQEGRHGGLEFMQRDELECDFEGVADVGYRQRGRADDSLIHFGDVLAARGSHIRHKLSATVPDREEQGPMRPDNEFDPPWWFDENHARDETEEHGSGYPITDLRVIKDARWMRLVLCIYFLDIEEHRRYLHVTVRVQVQ